MQKAMEEWGGSIQKATNGTITFTVFPSQQLGKAFDHYDMVRDGIADVAFINPGYQPGRFPIIDAGKLPFMMSKGGAGSQAPDAWYRKYAATEMKDVKYCFAFVHDYGLVPLQDQEDRGAGRRQGHEDQARPRHHRRARDPARRHQRAAGRRRRCATSWRRAWPTR